MSSAVEPLPASAALLEAVAKRKPSLVRSNSGSGSLPHDAPLIGNVEAWKAVKESKGYVRADELDLGDLDRNLAQRLGSHRVERPGAAAEGEGGAALLPAASKKAPWEIDVSKLVLKDAIAQGSFGTVHRGTYEGREVAVKLLDWGEDDTMSRSQLTVLRRAFKQEVAVWSTLSHRNVTQFIGASMGSSEGFLIPSEAVGGAPGALNVPGSICCVVVEYVHGGQLKDFLIRNCKKKLPLRTVLQLALDTANGLAYLHSKRIVHRDVKSENLLLDKNRTVKIADFGVARVEALSGENMTGATGTVGYMAPEVLDGKPYDRKADVYSFGITLWEIYKCEMPFPDLDFRAMQSVVRQGMRPSIPSCCPKDLAEIMRTCWDPSPEARPTMARVVEMLKAVDRKGGGMIPVTQERQPGCMCFR